MGDFKGLTCENCCYYYNEEYDREVCNYTETRWPAPCEYEEDNEEIE